jgi:hypothetical protein
MLDYDSSFYPPAILAVPMARDLALPTWAIFADLSAALLIAGALAPMAGRLVDTHGGWVGSNWNRYGLWAV